MIYETLLDESSFEATLYFAKNVRSLVGLNFKGEPKIISSILFEAFIKNKFKGKAIDAMIYKFNDMGNIFEYSDKYQTSLYSYDLEGNLLSMNRYNSRGRLINNTRFINKDGLLTDCVDTDHLGNEIARYSFVFDINLNLIEISVIDLSTNKLFTKYEYIYDSQKKCIKRKVLYNEKVENNFTRTFQYDNFGNIISIILYIQDGFPYGIDYEYYDYDDLGNWHICNCLAYDDNIIERKIIY